MSIFDKFFKFKIFTQKKAISKEATDLASFECQINELLSKDKFIAHSDCLQIIQAFSELYDQLYTLFKSGTLTYFCKTKGITQEQAETFLSTYADIKNKNEQKIITTHNEAFINKHLTADKTYLDNILHNVDPNILLDDEQRRVVLSDEDYTLVIAGAGAGKTTTIAAKVKYLVEKININPEQILVIS